MSNAIVRSLVIPVYNNEENIPPLLSALDKAFSSLAEETEVVFVVDGSPDNSWATLNQLLPSFSMQSQLIHHSRNFGAFTAIRTGIKESRGDFIAVMAADLQEPPQLAIEFFEKLQTNQVDVLFGQRVYREDPVFTKLLSRVYWGLYRKLVIKDIPRGGVDVFACNKLVKDALMQIEESNSSLLAQLFWVGFRRGFIPYKREKRQVGKSSWSFRRRFNYMIDSVFSFTSLPVYFLLFLGLFGIVVSVIGGSAILLSYFFGQISVAGYTAQMLTILFFGSLSLFGQGVIGLYVWRTLENSKHRPLSLISEKRKFPKD